LSDDIKQLKEGNEGAINDLHQQIQLVNTRVKTNVQAIDNYNKQMEQVKQDMVERFCTFFKPTGTTVFERLFVSLCLTPYPIFF